MRKAIRRPDLFPTTFFGAEAKFPGRAEDCQMFGGGEEGKETAEDW